MLWFGLHGLVLHIGLTSLYLSRCRSRGGEMGEFPPPPPPPLLFLSPLLNSFFSYPSNTSTRLWFYYITTKIHPPFQNPGFAPASPLRQSYPWKLHLLLTEFKGCTRSYGPSFFPFNPFTAIPHVTPCAKPIFLFLSYLMLPCSRFKSNVINSLTIEPSPRKVHIFWNFYFELVQLLIFEIWYLMTSSEYKS